MIVLAWSKGSIFFGYEKEWEGLEGLGRSYPPIFEVFVYEGLADFRFCRVQGVGFGPSMGECVFELDGMIEGTGGG